MLKMPQRRITPAHAGKSDSFAPSTRYNEDHPRTRGEKSLAISKANTIVGSPPHTRGKGPESIASPAYSGITPAHAGKSDAWSSYEIRNKDHPRTRGEKPLQGKNFNDYGGSPPHTRGKVRT